MENSLHIIIEKLLLCGKKANFHGCDLETGKQLPAESKGRAKGCSTRTTFVYLNFFRDSSRRVSNGKVENESRFGDPAFASFGPKVYALSSVVGRNPAPVQPQASLGRQNKFVVMRRTP